MFQCTRGHIDSGRFDSHSEHLAGQVWELTWTLAPRDQWFIKQLRREEAGLCVYGGKRDEVRRRGHLLSGSNHFLCCALSHQTSCWFSVSPRSDVVQLNRVQEGSPVWTPSQNHSSIFYPLYSCRNSVIYIPPHHFQLLQSQHISE